MKVLCLGGGGRICRESILDLVKFSESTRITVADVDIHAAESVGQWLDDPRVDVVQVDVRDERKTVNLMREYDVVMDGLPISLNDLSTARISAAKVNGINLNGMSNEWDFDAVVKEAGRVVVPGFGMTPGITNLMAMQAANQMDSVQVVRCSHGAFRPIAFSQAIAETTRIEYEPGLPSRVVFEDGVLTQVSPFSRPLDITLPEPYGTHTQYIIPHPEPVTLSQTLASKGIRLVEARGTWPPKNMRLIHAMYEWGILRNDQVQVGDQKVGVLDAIFAHCLQSPEGKQTELYGYALHVEVIGVRNGQSERRVLTHTHPPSDGSVDDWSGLRAYTRCVGIPMSIGAQMIGSGQVRAKGVVAPEQLFQPEVVFEELKKRDILIHEEVQVGWTEAGQFQEGK